MFQDISADSDDYDNGYGAPQTNDIILPEISNSNHNSRSDNHIGNGTTPYSGASIASDNNDHGREDRGDLDSHSPLLPHPTNPFLPHRPYDPFVMLRRLQPPVTSVSPTNGTQSEWPDN